MGNGGGAIIQREINLGVKFFRSNCPGAVFVREIVWRVVFRGSIMLDGSWLGNS